MPVSVKLLNDEIVAISKANTARDILMEFEKVLDDINLYAYKNWIEGEILSGPNFDRHYISVKLLYKYEEMPDPEGAKRLFSRDCLVKFEKDTLIKPVKIKSSSDIRVETGPDGRIRNKARTTSEPVWVVEIKMPRRYVDEFHNTDNEEVDGESLNTEEQISAEEEISGRDGEQFMNDEGEI